MAQELDSAGPSERAVALARTCLIIGGVVWSGFAAAMLVASRASEIWSTLAVALVGLAHFAVARFGSRRVAVFFALFGP